MRLSLAFLLAGFALRAAPLSHNRFHPDEALYATFARLIATGRDPLLSTAVVDKPPLPFYTMAASMTAFGPGEFGARLPYLLASLISIALLHLLTRLLYGRQAAAVAAAALALSPIAILFATTLFTDTLLVAFILSSMVLAARRRWAWAGLAFGLAFACKQTAVVFLPLVAAVGLVPYYSPGGGGRQHPYRPIGFLGPALLLAAGVLVWDLARQAPISFWVQGFADNNPGRLVRSNEIWPRLAGWAGLIHYITGSWLANLALALGLPVLLIGHRRPAPAGLYDFIFAGFAMCYLGAYWLLAFNVWDRYVLALAPIGAILLARVASALGRRLRSISPRPGPGSPLPAMAAALVLAAALLPPALTASGSGYPIGGDHGAYDGIDEIGEALQTVPSGSVLYDQWLSWELGFYAFDSPAHLVWMPGPEALADDLRSFGRASPRYIVAPSWESLAETEAAIAAAGFSLQPIQTASRRDGTTSFTLYRIWPDR